MPAPIATTGRAPQGVARRGGCWRLGMLAGAVVAMSAATGVTAGLLPAGVEAQTTESVALPAPAAVGQGATTNASISTSAAGGLNGPGGVEGTVGLMLATRSSVTDVAPDGSSSRRTTIDALNVVDAPAGVDAQLGFDTLVGATFDQFVTPVGSLTSSSLSGAATTDQRFLGQGVADAMDSMVIGFPGGPVDVGASWTSTGHSGQGTLGVPVTYQCRLTSVTGDSYTVEVSYSEAVDTDAPGGTVTGTVSGSGTLTGSVSNPLIVSGTMYQSVDGVLTGADGTAAPVRSDLSIALTSASG